MELPNWLMNLHLRRVVQRMQSDYTAIFGGRERELAELNAWLADDANPYALLLAPTGRGKTALVWHWLARQQHEWQVIFVPISIRYGNSNQADVLAALTHAFAHMHGELDEFSALQQTPSELQPKLAAYLRRELPDDTRVLLAIDGLDEATGWELGSDLLPENPPANLKILLSARDMAQHQRADWYHKLGLPADQTHDFTLAGLDRLALHELLIALGTPLDELATDLDVLGEFLRVSAGDPVIVRLLVQLLREERIQIGQISQLPADDLNAVFALWLNQLSAQQSQIAQILLFLFANAYGPLSARDLLGLAPDHFANADQITQAIAPLARFVIGDAETGYVFSHQKLRELYRDRLDAQTLAEWNARFVNYGKQAYREPTPYLCRFLVNHLRDAGEWQFTRHLLADFSPQQAWAEARYALEGSYNGYLRDLDVLQNWAIAQNDLALNIHCSLIKSSILGIASNLNGELLAYLVSVGTPKGKWSEEAALAHIEQQSGNEVQKLIALLEYGVRVPWEQAYELIQRAQFLNHDAYMTIYPLVPNEFKANILADFYEFFQAFPQVELIALLRFIQNLEPDWQAKFIEYLLQTGKMYISSSEMTSAEIIELVPAAWQTQVLELIQRTTQAQQHDIKADAHLSLVFWQYWPTLAPEQQQILYWSPSLDAVLKYDLSAFVFKTIPRHEQQGILEIFLQLDPERVLNSSTISKNILLLYRYCFPHEQRLANIALNYLIAQPQWLDQQQMALLNPAEQEKIAQHLLHLSPQQDQHPLLCWKLVICVEYVPSLRSKILEKLLKLIPLEHRSTWNEYYLAILPHLPKEQQTQILEQLWLNARQIKDTYEYVEIQTNLARCLSIQQARSVSQSLFANIDRLHHVALSIAQFVNLLKARPDFAEIVYNYQISLASYSLESADLIEYFPLIQQQSFAQQLFQYLIKHPECFTNHIYEISIKQSAANTTILFQQLSSAHLQQAFSIIQQQADTPIGIWLLRGLLNIQSYPHHRLIPFIKQISALEYHFALILALYPYLSPAEQEQLQPSIRANIPDLYHGYKLSTYQFPAELVSTVIEQILPMLDTILTASNGHRSSGYFALLNQLQKQQTPQAQQQLGLFIWHQIAQHPAWPINRIAHIDDLLEICLPYFHQEHIQMLVDSLIKQSTYERWTYELLMPYLNQNQLKQLASDVSNFEPLLQFYQIAHEQHHILDQTEYYQQLLATLQHHQAIYPNQWQFLEYMNLIGAYLHAEDRHKLYRNSLKLLNPHYFFDSESDQVVTETMQQMDSVQLVTIQTMFVFTDYGSKKARFQNFRLLAAILPTYLQTLSLDEQQQLAHQIYSSVEQVIVAWP